MFITMPQLDVKLREMRAQGKTWKQVSKALGVCPAQVRRWARKQGLTNPSDHQRQNALYKSTVREQALEHEYAFVPTAEIRARFKAELANEIALARQEAGTAPVFRMWS